MTGLEVRVHSWSYIMIELAAGPDGRFQRLQTLGEESPNSAEQCAG